MIQPDGGTTALYMNDVLSNSVLLSNSASTTSCTETYDPDGANTETNVSGGNAVNGNPYVFHYGTPDRITGNVIFGARYYDLTTGTWTQQDTLSAPHDPNNANRYLYASGDPINTADPTGNFSLWNLADDAAGVLVGASVGLACEGSTLGLGSFGSAVAGGAAGAAVTDALNSYEDD